MKNLFLGMMLVLVALSTQAQEKKNKNERKEESCRLSSRRYAKNALR